MGQKTFYITTPLYYVNAKPHIGHAYTNVICDAFARWKRFMGEKVFFLTGTDEHGTKIEKVAKSAGLEPRPYVDQIVPEFKELWRTLGISYDYFIRTTDENHKQVVMKVLKDLEARGEVYKASYSGWYCTPCESFWTELQLAQGKCPDCHREVQQLGEDNYFFKLSKYQTWLIEYIQSHPDFILPEMRRNEILGFLRQPLEDLCITRSRSRLQWGIDYPNSKDHVVYVWFDALLNYITASAYTQDENQFALTWPAEIHAVGKDILRQHAVYWPIMLQAMGLQMPKTILAHGWWTMQGAKVSKSRGNAVDPVALSQKYSVDALRYFLLHEVTLGQDGAFSEDLLAERYTTDLANDFGNLWFRIVTMLEKYFKGTLPEGDGSYLREPLIENAFALLPRVNQAMSEEKDPRQALDIIFDVFKKANQFVEEKKPWALAKDPAKKSELETTMLVLVESVAHAVVVLSPFLPETTKKVIMRLGIEDKLSIHSAAEFAKPFVPRDRMIERGEALFPRLDVEKSHES